MSEKKKVTLSMIKQNQEFRELIKGANDYLEVKGYTEHGLRHVGYVSATTANILAELELDERTVELGAIAGWIHDIGNSVNRLNHGITGAILAQPILMNMGMPMHKILRFVLLSVIMKKKTVFRSIMYRPRLFWRTSLTLTVQE